VKIPTERDLAWLARQRNDQSVSIAVLINGYRDEITDWIGGLLDLRTKAAKAEKDLAIEKRLHNESKSQRFSLENHISELENELEATKRLVKEVL